MKKTFNLVLSFLLAFSFMLVGVEQAYAFQTTNDSYPVSQGVKYSNYTYSGKPINHLEVDLSNQYTELQLGLPFPINTVSTLTDRANKDSKEGNRVVGAINANFFNMTGGYPLYLISQNNNIVMPEVLSDTKQYYVSEPIAFGVTSNGMAEIDYYDSDIIVQYNNQSIELNGLNRNREVNEGILFTPQYLVSKTPTNKYGMEVVVETPQTIGGTKFGQTLQGKVIGIRNYGDDNRPTIPRNGFVLSFNGKAMDKFKTVKIGEQISVSISIDPKWQDAKYIMASGPLLVYGGKVNITMDTKSSRAKQVTPRTAVAISKDKQKVHLVTVDKGMTLAQFAAYLAKLGVDRAINLDGGGSTTMGIRKYGSNTVVLANSPSGGTQRRISAIIEAVSTGATGTATMMKVTRDQLGTMLVGSTVTLKPNYLLDEHYNPLPINTNDFILTPTKNLVTVSGLSYTAVSPGSESITVQNGNASQRISITVVDAPATLSISSTSNTVEPGATMQFTAKAKDANGNNLIYSPSQLKWAVEGDIGTISSTGVFKSNGKYGKGKITATLGTKSVSKDIEIKETYTASTFAINNFENLADWRVEATKSTGKHQLANAKQYGKEGKYSVKLTYDMTGNTNGTAATYLRLTSLFKIPGNPQKIGVWMYGDGKGTWVRGYVRDAAGKRVPIDFTAENGQTWSGWKYVEASIPAEVARPITFESIYLAQPTVAKQKAGVVYFDKLQAVYKDSYKEPIFSDVSAYKKEIQYLVDRGLISGYGDGTFKPNQHLTRAHAAVLLTRALKLDVTKVTNPNFSDVPSNYVYYKQIAAIQNAGVMGGVGNGKFNPSANLTRAQMAKILVEAYDLSGTTGTKFTDVSENHWAAPYIYALAANNITTGYGDNTFKPNVEVSRAHFAVFLYRAINA
ncbi:Ig-like protein group 2 [Ureibacillus xyleni]|uniref:Ig-like protein group 2 n=1 Tax=Ureibacillus xyleni TaxID=614648 RepID=A0A285RAH7_9BACL|nr:S-layer homology domain-containing protein [Ureibacillus xyleni]SOB90874.1 Ig-like protein group 2 [Ureibacillus xyleni]